MEKRAANNSPSTKILIFSGEVFKTSRFHWLGTAFWLSFRRSAVAGKSAHQKGIEEY
ncbi:MAG: hypothetical protein ACRCVT_08660 [Leadbetterella sp.]